jgi:hypothetical protein
LPKAVVGCISFVGGSKFGWSMSVTGGKEYSGGE